MPLVTIKADSAPPVVEDPIKIECETFDGITVDTTYTPTSALQTFIEGSNWSVDYYSQVLGSDNEPTAQDLDRKAVYQQYRKIQGMDLKVSAPLTFDQEQTSTYMNATGSAYTFPFLTPNKGDMFVADVGDGRAGVFALTSVKRMTILKDSVYEISYQMVSYLTQERLEDLETKTIESLIYSRKSLFEGCGPFVTAEDQSRAQIYGELLQELIRRYLTDFLSQEHSCLLVPDQIGKTYDHFTTRFILQFLNTTDDARVRKIRERNITAEPVMQQPTLWDAVLYLDINRLYGCTQQVILATTQRFTGHPLLQALGYSGIPWVVFPLDAPTDVDSQYDLENLRHLVGIEFHAGELRRPAVYYRSQEERRPPYFQATPPGDSTQPWELPPDIHPVVKDDFYVLSEAFYHDTLEQSKLELLLRQCLQREALNLAQFDQMLGSVRKWDNLERYFYYPLVFVLLRYAMRGMQ